MLGGFFSALLICISLFSFFCFLKALYHRKQARSNYMGREKIISGDGIFIFSNLFNEKGKYHRKMYFLSLAGFVIPIILIFCVALIIELVFGINI